MNGPDASTYAMRPAVLEDIDTLVAIDARCFPAGMAYPREVIASLLRTRAGLTLVAERSQTILGFASLGLLRRRRLSPRSPRGELITMDVLPEFRRERIGWQLHHALERWLRTAGGRSIELHVAVDNAAAIQLYERLGYRTVGRIPQYYQETIDAWRMEKPLT